MRLTLTGKQLLDACVGNEDYRIPPRGVIIKDCTFCGNPIEITHVKFKDDTVHVFSRDHMSQRKLTHTIDVLIYKELDSVDELK